MSVRAPWRVQLASVTPDGLGALDDLSPAFGIEANDARALDLKVDGREVRVTGLYVTHRDGSLQNIRRLVIEVFFEGPVNAALDSDAPRVVLRREQSVDQLSKERGLTHELQLGVPEFDHAVYIDNDSTEADARRVLSRPATREAVLRLLDSGHVVQISHRAVRVEQDVHGPRVHPAHVLDALGDLLVVAKGGGLRQPRPERRGELASNVLLIVAACVGVAAWFFVRDFGVSALHVLGSVFTGGLAVFLARPVLVSLTSGDSGSAARVAQMSLAVFIIVVSSVLAVLAWTQ